PCDLVDLVTGPQQLAEVRPDLGRQVPAVGVDVLAEQRDLPDSIAREALDLSPNLARSAALLAPADRRDDAVGALRVAAHRDLHPRLERPLPMHRQPGREVSLLEAEAAARHPDAAGAEPVGEMPDRARLEGAAAEPVL